MSIEIRDENLLKKAKADFAVAYKELRDKKIEKALGLFRKIEEKYNDSADYRVGDVCNRSRAFIRIADAKINAVNVEPETEEEVLLEVVYNINAENTEKAVEYLKRVEKNAKDKAYVYYLYSLVHNLNENREETFAAIRKCIEADEYYKVIIYNEPDFTTLLEDEEFLEIVQ